MQENLLVGMALVTRGAAHVPEQRARALIVAINIPLAVLFAFLMLFLRGKSANLLSIGAVDFGIIVDSSVIMVENIFRHLTPTILPTCRSRKRISARPREVERSLLFSTAIMVCAFLPLFTMKGPEGQIFGPMAETYAFALAGALLLAVTLSPVLCLLAVARTSSRRATTSLSAGCKTRYLRQLRMLPELSLGSRWRIRGLVVVSRVAVSADVGTRVHAASSKRATCISAARSRSMSRSTKSRIA